MAYLLDTNIIAGVLQHEKKVWQKLEKAYNEKEDVFLCSVVYYEVKRGLLAAGATRKMITFNNFRQKHTMIGIDDESVLDKASQIYAELRGTGRLIPDNDILIAAIAMTYNVILVTNDKHFERIDELNVENWLIH